VRTTGGTVRGRRTLNGYAYLGVPYAAPPVGVRYLRAPQPVPAWEGVRDASRFGAAPPQRALGGGADASLVAGDDYLNVNVFTPDPTAGGLPVLVWICLGGFVVGSNAWGLYDGDAFARDGVVTVTVNARLGVEGFLTLRDAPCNRGVLDWIAALEWVQLNIAAFGGDPGAVTVAGHSAGGAATAHLLTLQRSRDLLTRAIIMSGPPFDGDADRARSRGDAFCAAIGISPTVSGLRTVSSHTLLTAQMQAFEAVGGSMDPVAVARELTFGGPPFRPVIDGDVLVGEPTALMRAGAGDHAGLLVGATAAEFTLMLDHLAGHLDDGDVRDCLAALGYGQAAAGEFVAANARLDRERLVGQAVSDTLFRRWPRESAALRAGPGGTWCYEFGWAAADSGGFATHGVEVPFAWATVPDAGLAEGPRRLVDAFHGACVRFVTAGDPGWPAEAIMGFA
jgi:para-nitrobenzyl esterase